MSSVCNYPLRFDPLFRRYLWGGRRLGDMLGKPIGPGDDYAESWEIVDHGEDQSRVAAGSLAGVALGTLVEQQSDALLGAAGKAEGEPVSQFPLLMKFLDCNRTLSVQVHPNDEQAAQLDPPDLGKTEAWVVLAADPGSKIYAGLRGGVDRDQLREALEQGRCETCLHTLTPQPGDCIFIPAGSVHALGAGLVVAEIQQASDTTFRLYDWNRVDAQGQPRPLHLEQSLATIDYTRGPIGPQTPQPTADPTCERLVACDKFILDRRRIGQSEQLGGDDRFRIVAVVEGAVSLAGDPCPKPLERGETALLPAAAVAVTVSGEPSAVVLEIYLPEQRS